MIDRQFLDKGGYAELTHFSGCRLAKQIADEVCIEQPPVQKRPMCTWCNASPAEIGGLCHPCNDYRQNGGGQCS